MQLHVEEWCETGPLVVWLHGLASRAAVFEGVARAALPGHRVFAPDLRGHGSSSWEPPWSLEQHLEDLLESVPGEARLWVGHSFGGRLVVELAARHPELVDRAVLLDPALRIVPPNALLLAEEELAKPQRDYSRAAAAAIYGELSRRPPPYDLLRCPVTLVRGTDESVIGPNRLRVFQEALGDRLETVHVPGGHDVHLDAFDETAAAVASALATA